MYACGALRLSMLRPRPAAVAAARQLWRRVHDGAPALTLRGLSSAPVRAATPLSAVQPAVRRLVMGVRARCLSTAAAAPSAAVAAPAADGAVAAWLFGCSAMVFGMVVLGGVTRLTRSGLSMTEWRPVSVLPPMSAGEWEEEFGKYRATPEFQRLNMRMSLDDFKPIYYMEWAHRVWGRAIGVAFALPLLGFAAAGRLPRGITGRLCVIFALGGAQGAVGWWMVRSGIEHTHVLGFERSEHDTPRVSPYRLATHLGFAFLTQFLLFYTALDVAAASRAAPALAAAGSSVSASSAALARALAVAPLRRSAHALSGLLAITVLSGAFVAGNDAGHAYNTWPLMGDGWAPPAAELWNDRLQPAVRNFFETTGLVQFNHRMLAYSTLAGTAAVSLLARRPQIWLAIQPASKTALHALAGMAVVQVTLGVTTLLYYVPVELGAAHQAGAFALWTIAVWLMHSLKIARPSSVKALRAALEAAERAAAKPLGAPSGARAFSTSAPAVANKRATSMLPMPKL
jgi:cytochrome c oxidase assembly protein subunit 15